MISFLFFYVYWEEQNNKICTWSTGCVRICGTRSASKRRIYCQNLNGAYGYDRWFMSRKTDKATNGKNYNASKINQNVILLKNYIIRCYVCDVYLYVICKVSL